MAACLRIANINLFFAQAVCITFLRYCHYSCPTDKILSCDCTKHKNDEHWYFWIVTVCSVMIFLVGNITISDRVIAAAALVDLNWPVGMFSLPEDVDGCPIGLWETGNHTHYGLLFNRWSREYHSATVVTDTQVDRKFCTKTYDAAINTVTWPSGSYCIMRSGGTCPAGEWAIYFRMQIKLPLLFQNLTTYWLRIFAVVMVRMASYSWS